MCSETTCVVMNDGIDVSNVKFSDKVSFFPSFFNYDPLHSTVIFHRRKGVLIAVVTDVIILTMACEE